MIHAECLKAFRSLHSRFLKRSLETDPNDVCLDHTVSVITPKLEDVCGRFLNTSHTKRHHSQLLVGILRLRNQSDVDHSAETGHDGYRHLA